MWFTGIIFEILFSFYTLNAFLVEKPHRRSVYAVFPYPNDFYGRNKIPAVLFAIIFAAAIMIWVVWDALHHLPIHAEKRE